MDKESIKIGTSRFKAHLKMFTGKQGEYFVSYFPSLNVSGYGKTFKESTEDAEYNLKVFIKDIMELNKSLIDKELKKLGWERNTFFKKKFSKASVDEKGVLLNFDSPEDVIQTTIETPA
ncbi:MAG: hypothetical protein WD048_14430 [Chitinophagales bacterium]